MHDSGAGGLVAPHCQRLDTSLGFPLIFYKQLPVSSAVTVFSVLPPLLNLIGHRGSCDHPQLQRRLGIHGFFFFPASEVEATRNKGPYQRARHWGLVHSP